MKIIKINEILYIRTGKVLRSQEDQFNHMEDIPIHPTAADKFEDYVSRSIFYSEANMKKYGNMKMGEVFKEGFDIPDRYVELSPHYAPKYAFFVEDVHVRETPTAKEYLKKEGFIDFVVNPSDLVEYQKTVSQLMEDYKNNCL